MRIVVVEHNKGKLEPPEEYLAFPALIGGKTYLNVVWDTKLVRRNGRERLEGRRRDQLRNPQVPIRRRQAGRVSH